MGLVYSVNLTLVHATPYTLRYLCEDTGQPGSTTIVNADTAPVLPDTADLRYDALSAAGHGAGGLPLRALLGVAVTSQAEARHLLMADAAAGVTPGIANLHRAKAEVMARNVAASGMGWAIDADLGVGASAGYAVLVITPPGGGDGFAYLTLHLDHSYDDGPYYNI